MRSFLKRAPGLVPPAEVASAQRVLTSLKLLGKLPPEWEAFPPFQAPEVLCAPHLILETLLMWKQTQLARLVRPLPYLPSPFPFPFPPSPSLL